MQVSVIEPWLIPADLLPDLYFRLSESGIVLSGNQAVEGALGFCLQELIGQSFLDLLNSDDQESLKWPEPGGQPSRSQVRLVDDLGKSIRYDLFMSSSTGPTVEFVVSARALDINFESVPLQSPQTGALLDRLLEREAEIERAGRVKSKFLANMSHELRTPLTAILGISEALEVGLYGEFDDEQVEAFRTIRECGKSLFSLISDILEVAKLDADVVLRPEYIVPRELLDSVVETSNKAIGERSVEVEILCSAEEPPFYGDGARIKQLLSNLMSNAVKFTTNGSKVGLEYKSTTSGIEFAVWDSGPGIAEIHREQIFEPFLRLEDDLVRTHSGTGIGLALVKRLTTLMQGHVEVSEHPSGGACFRVWFPCLRDEMCGESELDESREDPNLMGEIVLVEDHTPTADYLCNVLKSWGFETERFDSADAFRAAAKRLSPALVLMDSNLGESDGIECVEWMRSQPKYKAVPIVLLTTNDEVSERRRGLDAGATAYVEKPIDLQQLSRCIASMMSRA